MHTFNKQDMPSSILHELTYLMKDQVWTYMEYQRLASLNMYKEFENHLKSGDTEAALKVLAEKGERFFTREIFQTLSSAVIFGDLEFLRKVMSFFLELSGDLPTFCAWGNSHLVPLFSSQKNIYNELEINPFVFSITGASASGIPKLSSTYNLFDRIMLADDLLNPRVTFLNFGQVDIELGIYYKKLIKSENIGIYDFIEQITDGYIKCAAMLKTKACILPIGLPTISEERSARNVAERFILQGIDDASQKNAVQKRLLAIYPPYEERKKYALKYNEVLFKKAKAAGLTVLDTSFIFTKKTGGGGVKKCFTSAFDAHYTSTEMVRQYFTAYVLNRTISRKGHWAARFAAVYKTLKALMN